MTLKEDLVNAVKNTFASRWSERDGDKVPESDAIQLGNDAVKLEGTVLYADLTDSTALVNTYSAPFAAEIYKTYLYCAARIIRSLSGAITAYDGDRVMAVFVGDSKNSDAAKCGLRINWAVRKVIQPAIQNQYPKVTFKLRQVVGIDTSDLFIARTGIRGSNDLVWVGRAANYAAKMSDLPSTYPTYLSRAVYGRLNEESKLSDGGQDMWTDVGANNLGIKVYGSTFQWGL